MLWIERFTSSITATQARLAIVVTLAVSIFLYLAVVVSAQRTHVAERVEPTVSATDDVINDRRLGPASWDCASVPITVQCGSTQPQPGE